MSKALGSRRNRELTELETLVNTIESLRPAENVFKDYVYPVIAPFLATLLGAWAGYTASVRKQGRDNDIQKLQSLNRLLLQAESCFRCLESIKDNYSETIDSKPWRGMSFGPLVLDYEKASTDVSNLVFLTKTLDVDSKNINTNRLAFNNLPRIKQIFHNFNQVLAIWEQRNVEVKPIFAELRKEANAGVVEGGNINEIFKKVEKEDVAVVCHLSENGFKLTDDGLKELLGLMQELPELAKGCFKESFLKEEGGIIGYLNEPAVTGKILKKIPKLDVSASIQVFGGDLSA
jgi:hypothetical protein